MIILSALNTGVWISRELYDDFDLEVVKLARRYGMSDRSDIQTLTHALKYLNAEVMPEYYFKVTSEGLMCDRKAMQ